MAVSNAPLAPVALLAAEDAPPAALETALPAALVAEPTTPPMPEPLDDPVALALSDPVMLALPDVDPDEPLPVAEEPLAVELPDETWSLLNLE
jgi:hypothetical protein